MYIWTSLPIFLKIFVKAFLDPLNICLRVLYRCFNWQFLFFLTYHLKISIINRHDPFHSIFILFQKHLQCFLHLFNIFLVIYSNRKVLVNLFFFNLNRLNLFQGSYTFDEQDKQLIALKGFLILVKS